MYDALMLLSTLPQVSQFFWDYYQLFVAQGLISDITAAASNGVSSSRRIYFGGFSGGSAVSVLGAMEPGASRVGNVYLFGHEKVSWMQRRHCVWGPEALLVLHACSVVIGDQIWDVVLPPIFSHSLL
jgi:hypothetical protein